MDLLKIDSKIPELCLKDQDGNSHNLKDLCSNLTLLYFYPKALTSGCTTEACGIRDGMALLKEHKVTVFGISPDSPKKLSEFIAKENLNFTLLSDEELLVSKAFGAYGPKSMYGRTYNGVYRVSFLVQNNKIIAQFPKVTPSEHLQMIIDYIEKNNL